MILILYLWGSCIAYLVIIGDSFSPLLGLATGKALHTVHACGVMLQPAAISSYPHSREAEVLLSDMQQGYPSTMHCVSEHCDVANADLISA